MLNLCIPNQLDISPSLWSISELDHLDPPFWKVRIVMPSAIEVARYLIHLASPENDEDADRLCHMRLQKLLYYVQGWHLGTYGIPLFEGHIEAWQHGPVVREVYPDFKSFGSDAISLSQGSQSLTLSEKDKRFIAGIFEHYKQFSATALRTKTHREKPWMDSWKPNSHNEVSQSLMRDFFMPQSKKALLRSDSRLNVKSVNRALEQIQTGQVRTVEEIRRDLQNLGSEFN
jgi:uncharacterized phage-associated protein